MSENKYVIFKLGNESYGLPIESVERILPVQNVTRLPRTPKMFLGVFELRGTTLPALDARLRFEMEESPEAKNFVVVLTGDSRCALRVDEVDGILSLEEGEIDENPALLDNRNDDFLRAIGKKDDRLVVLLDPANVVPKALRAKVAKVA